MPSYSILLAVSDNVPTRLTEFRLSSYLFQMPSLTNTKFDQKIKPGLHELLVERSVTLLSYIVSRATLQT